MGLSRCNSQIFSFENRKVKSVSGTMGDKKELEKMNSNVTIWERIFSDNRLLNCRQTKPRYVFHRWRHEVKNAEGTKLFRSGLYLETERVWAKESVWDDVLYTTRKLYHKHRFQGLSMFFLFTWQSSVDWFGRQLMGFWTFHVHQNEWNRSCPFPSSFCTPTEVRIWRGRVLPWEGRLRRFWYQISCLESNKAQPCKSSVSL